MSDRGIGDNQPPTFREELESEVEDLAAEHGMLMLRQRKLPREPASDADMALVIAWTVDARKLAAKWEARREERKAPVLEQGRAIDDVYGRGRDALKREASQTEQRNGPFLAAKATREREEARKALEIARAEEQRKRDEAIAAREAEQAAADAARAAQEALAESVARDAAEVAQREQEARDAERAAAEASKAAVAAVGQAQKAEHVADKAEEVASSPLQRSASAAGSANLKTVYDPRVVDWPALRDSCGWIGAHLNDMVIFAALEKVARKGAPLPEIPGVEWADRNKVNTRASRSTP